VVGQVRHCQVAVPAPPRTQSHSVSGLVNMHAPVLVAGAQVAPVVGTVVGHAAQSHTARGP
jgi:hypothetical protein